MRSPSSAQAHGGGKRSLDKGWGQLTAFCWLVELCLLQLLEARLVLRRHFTVPKEPFRSLRRPNPPRTNCGFLGPPIVSPDVLREAQRFFKHPVGEVHGSKNRGPLQRSAAAKTDTNQSPSLLQNGPGFLGCSTCWFWCAAFRPWNSTAEVARSFRATCG